MEFFQDQVASIHSVQFIL